MSTTYQFLILNNYMKLFPILPYSVSSVNSLDCFNCYKIESSSSAQTLSQSHQNNRLTKTSVIRLNLELPSP